MLISSDIVAGSIASTDPFPTDRTATDSVLFFNPLVWIDGVLWSGAVFVREDGEYAALLAMYV